MRWFHEGVDRLRVVLMSQLAPRVFRHGVDSACLRDHLDAIRFDLPSLTTARRYTVAVQSLVGEVETELQVRWGLRPDLPVVVYHHGLAELPYDKLFRAIFRAHAPVDAHLVAIRAPFHRSWLDLSRGLSTLERFMAMCAVSVRLVEAIRFRLITHGAQGCLVTGMSLGGFVALTHHLVYGAADGYLPLLAGPDLAHVMLDTHFRRFLAPQALTQPALIRQRLDLRQAFQNSNSTRVFPLLARYDLDMLYAHHRACYVDSKVPVVTIDRGHTTGALTFATLRQHILTHLNTDGGKLA
jgi:hypothetical protein